jgi:SAM-dependent methyltransferase
MESIYKIISESSAIEEVVKYYWGYQYRLGEEVLVPYLREIGAFSDGNSVAEVGSAEGGVLAAFVVGGAKNALGTDIVQSRLDHGAKISTIAELPLEFVYQDIVDGIVPDSWLGAYDLILLRDVIEHLDDATKALSNIRKMLKPNAYLFVTFPPYHSPFGGHQHTVANFWGKFPYIHLLPDFLFHSLIASGRKNDIAEVKRLQKIRLTPKKFVESAHKAGFSISHEDFYMLRPVYKMKFGLPTLKLTAISSIPLVKGLFSLEAAYLLRNRE